jgi:transposase
MASIQAYQSHGIRYYRIVESYRKEGKPAIRVLAHLGKVDDILRTHRQHDQPAVKISSVSAGAVTALHRLAIELDVSARIDRAISLLGHSQIRDGLTVGESLLASMISRACAPRSKRAFSQWAETTHLPELMRFSASDLTSQHFWDQMNAIPLDKLAVIEHELVGEVIRIEGLHVKALAYDTTNFHTHIASTNRRATLPQRGHNKQGRNDLRQMGLALVVDQESSLPLAHVLYEGARSDMRTFADFLKPVRKRLRELTGQPEQLTLVFDAGASSQQNLKDFEHYVTAVKPSNHVALLAEAAEQLTGVCLSTGATVRAWRTTRVIAGKRREAVVIFSPQLQQGQIRGLHQSMARSQRELSELGLSPRMTAEAAKRKLDKIRGRQYLRSLLCWRVDADSSGTLRISVWSDWTEYQRLVTRYFGLRVLISDRAEWTTAQIIESYRGQSKVESAFRDLKDPHMLSTRPQFHWTDHKLHVHAFMCVTAYLLTTLLHWRASRNAAFEGSSRRLLAELAEIRYSRIIEVTGRKGRPRMRSQLEEMTPGRKALAEALEALPVLR